jgi:hypothetical protein
VLSLIIGILLLAYTVHILVGTFNRTHYILDFSSRPLPLTGSPDIIKLRELAAAISDFSFILKKNSVTREEDLNCSENIVLFYIYNSTTFKEEPEKIITSFGMVQTNGTSPC